MPQWYYYGYAAAEGPKSRNDIELSSPYFSFISKTVLTIVLDSLKYYDQKGVRLVRECSGSGENYISLDRKTENLS
jgi:hypothetical protein